MRKNIKRVIAGLLTAMLMLSLVNLPALSLGLASEPSGYEVGVEYSEDNTSATLVGDTTGLKEGVQLDKLVDSEGQELDPYGLYQTVEENGTYQFTLYYQEAVDTQGADQPATEEKTQELEVVVDGIVEAESQETPAADAGVDQEPPATEMPALPTGDPLTAGRVVPLDVLVRSTAESRATKNVEIYAYEVDHKLSDAQFSGGALVKGAEGLPQVQYRQLEYAAYVKGNTGSKFPITGLYYYDSKWFYTTEGTTGSSNEAGNISVGFELPSDAVVRLYYKASGSTKYQLYFQNATSDFAKDYKMSINGDSNSGYNGLMYPQGTKIILEFNVPLNMRNIYITVEEYGWAQYTDTASPEGTTLTDLKIIKVGENRYTLMFTVPNKAVHINFWETPWDSYYNYEFALGTGSDIPAVGESVNNTYFKSTNGASQNAVITHTAGTGLNRGSISYQNQGSIHTPHNSSMPVSKGGFQPGKTVTLDMRMERGLDGSYTWKPMFFVLQVYTGQQYVSGSNYRTYYIPISTSMSSPTIDTPLDFGGSVTTTLKQWQSGLFQYTIEMKGMIYAFAIYDKPTTTNQQDFVIVALDGINLETTRLSTEFGKSKIYLFEQLRANNAGNVGSSGYNRVSLSFYIDPLYGYSAPTVNLINQKTYTKYYDHTWRYNYDDEYYYWHQIEGNASSSGPIADGMNPATFISITAQPVRFTVKYYTGQNGSVYYNPNVTMTASQNLNYGIEYQNNGLNNIKGYNVWVYNNGSQVKQITNNGNNLWIPNQDVITFKTIYDQVDQVGLPKNANLELRIVPVQGSGSEGYVKAYYDIVRQTSFAKINNGADLPSGTFITQDPKPSINAYAGATARLTGYKEQFQSGNKKYMLYSSASSLSGTVTAGGTFASLKYLLATTVTVDTSTLGTGNNYNQWKSAIEGKWFTSVNNFNHSFTLTGTSGLNAGSNGNLIFNGWGIKKADGTVVPVTDGMMYQGNLNFYLIGTVDGNLWSDIFNNGTCTLVATWRSNVAKVTTANGTTIVDQTGTAVEILEGQKTMVMSATFRYANTSVTQQELQNLADTNQLRVALVKKNPSGTGGWQVRSFDNSQTTGFSRPSITVLSNGDFRISFTFTQMSGGQEVELDPVYNDGANFRIFAWTSANTGTEGLTADTICSKLNAAEAAASEGNAYVNPYQDIAPSVMIPISMLYKVRSSNGTIGNMPGTDVEIYQGATSFKIVGTFQYGDGSATLDEIQTLYNNGAADGKLRVALIKQNPAGGNWSQRVYGSTATNGFTGPVFTAKGNTFKVEFTVSGTNNGAIDPQWNDGANFRIYVWTAANVNGADVSATTICNELNGSASTTHNQNIPSVSVMSTMLYKVTDKNGNIGSVAEMDVEANDGGPLTVEAKFRYGDGTADEEAIQALFDNGALHIALLKKDPEIWGSGWVVHYDADSSGQNRINPPTITKAAGENTFTVSFQVSTAVNGLYDDGAKLRILVWTDANGTNTDGTAITAANIMNALNNPNGEDQSDISGIAWNHFNIILLYKVVGYGDLTSNVTVLSTDTNIPLSATFKYDFDTSRYPSGYNGRGIRDLIANGDIYATLDYKKNGEENWTSVDLEVDVLTVKDAGQGLIRFEFNFTPESEELSAFDGAEFKIKVQSKANDAPAEHTATVTYVSEPTAYVNIPKYIILDDNNSNVTSGDVKQDGYAGKLVEVTYNDTTLAGDFKPDIEVKVQDGVVMKEGSINGAEVADMAIGIYDTNGVKLNRDTVDTGYCSVGTLSATQTSLPFWMNVKRSNVKDQQYYATVIFILKFSGSTT